MTKVAKATKILRVNVSTPTHVHPIKWSEKANLSVRQYGGGFKPKEYDPRMAQPRTNNVWSGEPYTCPELRVQPARAGAMDAYTLPSKGTGRSA
jgi:hypothetical protein